MCKIKRTLSVVFLSQIFALLSMGATIKVPGDQPTIQDGINAASGGDTVSVGPGVYIENIIFGGNSIVLIGEEGADATVLEPSNPGQPTISITNGEGVGTEFNGFTVRNGGPTFTFIIHNGANVLIQHNIFHNNIPVGTQNIEVISIQAATATVTRNVFYNNGGIGCVGLRGGAENSWIINNTFDGNERGFFSIAGGGNAINNLVTNSIERGVGCYTASNFTLLDYNNVWNNNPNYDAPGVAGSNSISEDPLYFDEISHDYHLFPGSPCLNAGHPDPMYNDPDGTRNDIGAFPIDYVLPIAMSINMGPSSNHDTVTTLTPEIFWSYYDTSATTQAAFQIQVGTDLDWTVAEQWDPGPVYSGDTSIIYAGVPPGNHGKYYLRIRVNDGTNWGSWNSGKFITQVGHIIIVPTELESIQEAIDVAGNGDTISVLAGTYEENIDFSGKTLLLVGQDGKSSTVLSPADPNIATIRIASGEEAGTEIKDFTITGGGPTNTVVIGGGASVLINYCTFYDNIPVGTSNIEVISISGATATITRNLFYGNGGIGCVGLREGAENSWIINNTFDGNERGFFSIAAGGNAINNLVTNSIERGVGCYTASNFTLLDYNNVWNNNPNYDAAGVAGSNSISEDPLYFDEISHDYHLFPGSPCFNAGHPDPMYNDPDGTRNDIGAFPVEYVLPIAADINMGPSSNHDTVTTLTPEIFWSYYDTSATTQAAFQIQAGTDPDWAVAELWDTGPVYSGDTSIIYAGVPPGNHGKYYLRIRVNDGTDWGSWNSGKFITQVGHIIIVPTELESIQEAINVAGNGDTISVLAGTYEENIDFSGKTLLLVGQDGKSNTILSPANPNIATIRMTSGEEAGTEIKDFTITGGGPTNTVVIDGGASVLINYCTFHNNIPVGTSNREVISVSSATATITRNLFYENGGIGCVGLRAGAASSWIINNTFDSNERGFFSIANGGFAINNIVTNSIERGVGCLSTWDFTILDYNDVWNNNPNYDIGGVADPSSISVDPLYNDPTNYDYTLDEASLCIDAGDPNPAYNDPDGSRCDMGAFPAGTFICGDVDNNDALNLLDITYLIRFLYQGGTPPYSASAADANGDGFINILDITYLINYLYKDGPEPIC